MELEVKKEQENEEMLLFPKKEWDKLIKWKPVALLDPYNDAPQAIKDYHNNYVKLWLNSKKKDK